MGTWLVNQIVGALLGLVFGGVQSLWGLLSTSFLVSPDVTGLPQVSAIMDTSLVVVDTCYALVIIAAGVTVMTHGTVQIRYTAGDLLPRLVVGFIAANFARPLCSGLTELANGLTRGLTGDTVSSSGSFTYMIDIIGGAGKNQGSNALVLLVIGLLLAVLTGMLLCGWYVRLGVLIALVAIAPVGLACHGLPYTDGAARLWWRSMLGCLGVVIVQAFALHSTLRVFANPQVNYPALGLPVDPSSLTNLLIVVCMLWITIKIPGMMRRFATTGRSHNPVGMVLRMMVIQTATRMLHLPAPRRRSANALTTRQAAKALPTGQTATGRTGGYRPSADHTIGSWRPQPSRAPRTTTAGPPTVGPPTTPAPSSSAGTRVSAGSSASTATTSPPRPVIPTGVTPATAMPATRPAWQTSTPPAPSGRGQASPRLPARHPAPRTGTAGRPRRGSRPS